MGVNGRLYLRGAIWHGWYYDKDGRRVRISTGCTSKRAAGAKLKQAELIGQGGSPPGGIRHNLREAAEQFLQSAAVELADGTVEMYRQKAGHLLRLMGEQRDLSSLSVDLVRTFISTRLTEGASRSTVAKELVTLRRVLEHAHESGHFRRRPVEVVPEFKFKYIPRERWLTPEQSIALMKELPEKRRLWVLLAVLAGPRLGEIERLQWEHIDLRSGWATVPGTKTEQSRRKVPLAPTLIAALALVKMESGPVVEAWHNVRRDLRAYCKKLKLPVVSPNDLRRTFASWLKQQGTDSLVVAHLLGHTTTRMVELVYGRLTRKEYRQAVDTLPALDDAPRPAIADDSSTVLLPAVRVSPLAYAALVRSGSIEATVQRLIESWAGNCCPPPTTTDVGTSALLPTLGFQKAIHGVKSECIPSGVSNDSQSTR